MSETLDAHFWLKSGISFQTSYIKTSFQFDMLVYQMFFDLPFFPYHFDSKTFFYNDCATESPTKVAAGNVFAMQCDFEAWQKLDGPGHETQGGPPLAESSRIFFGQIVRHFCGTFHSLKLT